MEWNDAEYSSLRCYHDAERVQQYYSSSIRSSPTFLPQQQPAISRIRFYMTMIIMVEQKTILFFVYPTLRQLSSHRSVEKWVGTHYLHQIAVVVAAYNLLVTDSQVCMTIACTPFHNLR